MSSVRYELAVSLWNATSDEPIYVMSPDMRGYVQGMGGIANEAD